MDANQNVDAVKPNILKIIEASKTGILKES